MKAWFTGDAAKVHLELERSLTVPAGADDTGEQERRQLLRVVAKRMRRCPDLLEPCSQSPELNLCVRLLWHTAFSDAHLAGSMASQTCNPKDPDRRRAARAAQALGGCRAAPIRRET